MSEDLGAPGDGARRSWWQQLHYDVIEEPSIGAVAGWLLTGLLALVAVLTIVYAPNAVDRDAAGETSIIPLWAGRTAIIGVALLALLAGWEPVLSRRLGPILARMRWPVRSSMPRDGGGILARPGAFAGAALRTGLLSLWRAPSFVLSVIDYGLARPVAILAGTKIGAWLPAPWQRHSAWPRYAILLTLLGAATAAAYRVPPPDGLWGVLGGIVVVLGVVRRWQWIERDRESFLAVRQDNERTQRIGFAEDLRDEALTAMVFLFVLVPFGLRQVYVDTCAAGPEHCAFRIAGLALGAEPGLRDWLDFFGAELFKSVPFVDWSEVFRVDNGSPIEQHTPLGAQIVFFLRASFDLLLLAAVLQALQIAGRTRAQDTAFWSGLVPILDPFAERDAFRKVDAGRRAFPWLEVAQAPDAADFPNLYGPGREVYHGERLIQVARGRQNDTALTSLALVDPAARCGALALLARQAPETALTLIADQLAFDASPELRAAARLVALEAPQKEAMRALEALLTREEDAAMRARIERTLEWHRDPETIRKRTSHDMVRIEPGTFRMGSPNDKGDPHFDPEAFEHEMPARQVTVAHAFEIGRYPVTFDDYLPFCTATGRKEPYDGRWGKGRQPVINVTWHDAHAYCAWLNETSGDRFRLPTEAEWEFACRAGSKGPYSFEDPEKIGEYAWYGKNSGGRAHPVDERDDQGHPIMKPNGAGLFHMHGNVLEWCADSWHDSYDGAPGDGRAWIGHGDVDMAVLRGGSWADNPHFLRSALRLRYNRGVRYLNVGFRSARTLPR